MNLLRTLALLLASSSAALAVTYSFDTATDFTNNFTNTTGAPSFSAGTGLSGGGSVSLGLVNAISVNTTSFSGTTTSVVISTYFQFSTTTAGSARPLSIGFTSGNADTYVGSANTSGTDIRVALNRGTHPAYGIGIYNAGTQVAASSNNVTLVDGNWYNLKLTIGGNSGGSYTGVFAELYDSTSAGVLGSQLKLLNNTGANYSIVSSLTSDSDVYAFFGTQSTNNSIPRIDDFSVTAAAIPEPSTYAALFGLGVLGLAAVRRRRR